jgi:hypothetical protein
MARKNLLPYLGEKKGSLVISGPARRAGRATVLSCVCDCGAFAEVSLRDWTQGRKKSCGCKKQVPGRPGDRVGDWTLLSRASSGPGGFWLCRCACGLEAVRKLGDLRRGGNPSCWDCSVDGKKRASALIRHGMTDTREYSSWTSMLARCRRASGRNKSYAGVSVCARWDPRQGGSFENFFTDLGWRPPGTSLDRLDPAGNYEPGNTAWSTFSEQTKNRRPHWVRTKTRSFLWGGKRERRESLLDNEAELSQN